MCRGGTGSRAFCLATLGMVCACWADCRHSQPSCACLLCPPLGCCYVCSQSPAAPPSACAPRKCSPVRSPCSPCPPPCCKAWPPCVRVRSKRSSTLCWRAPLASRSPKCRCASNVGVLCGAHTGWLASSALPPAWPSWSCSCQATLQGTAALLRKCACTALPCRAQRACEGVRERACTACSVPASAPLLLAHASFCARPQACGGSDRSEHPRLYAHLP